MDKLPISFNSENVSVFNGESDFSLKHKLLPQTQDARAAWGIKSLVESSPTLDMVNKEDKRGKSVLEALRDKEVDNFFNNVIPVEAGRLMASGMAGKRLAELLLEKFDKTDLIKSGESLKAVLEGDGLVGCVLADTTCFPSCEEAKAEFDKSPNKEKICAVLKNKACSDCRSCESLLEVSNVSSMKSIEEVFLRKEGGCQIDGGFCSLFGLPLIDSFEAFTSDDASEVLSLLKDEEKISMDTAETLMEDDTKTPAQKIASAFRIASFQRVRKASREVAASSSFVNASGGGVRLDMPQERRVAGDLKVNILKGGVDFEIEANSGLGVDGKSVGAGKVAVSKPLASTPLVVKAKFAKGEVSLQGQKNLRVKVDKAKVRTLKIADSSGLKMGTSKPKVAIPIDKEGENFGIRLDDLAVENHKEAVDFFGQDGTLGVDPETEMKF